MGRAKKLSQATEDYLKAIYELQRSDQSVSTNGLATLLDYKPASVTGMIKKLARHEPKLVNYTRHRGVRLTLAGKKIALEVIRHHRLIELYLSEALGYSWDEVHAEAEGLEHVISEEFEDRIAYKLGNPQFDPHGEPIPTKEGIITRLAGVRLSDLESGQSGKIVRVLDDDPALLRYLARLGMQPEARLAVTGRAPLGGLLYVQTDTAEIQAFRRQVTDRIYVQVDK